MKLPNWFKITWWIILLLLTGIILFKRYEAITTGQSVPADVFVFLIFVALMLVPIFSEIEFFGLKLKREIEELKSDIRIKFGDIKNEIRNTQTQTLNQTIQAYGQYGPPPPDSKLPELEEEIDRIVKAKLQEHGVIIDQPLASRIDVPEDNLTMFKVRYNIETQLRRIWENRFDEKAFDQRFRHQPIMRIIQDLTKYEIIDNNFYGILREILSICNYAIHGEQVTDNQVNFVSKNAKVVLDYLRETK
jgi:cytidylate kinase